MKKQRLIKTEERADAQRVAHFLRGLADRIESGRVVLMDGEQEVAVDLPDALTLEVELDRKDKGPKGTKHSLEVEIEWTEGGKEKGSIRLG